ncbi:diguanylate cyclase domain-containing protein [Roseateles caseinilyticus]|nr:diguanylate cyclase [Pelomonas sp. P7]
MPTRMLPERLTLRRLLTLPYAALVLALALLMGLLSWRAGRDTVDSLSAQLLVEAVGRIAVSLERHVGGADAVLEAAFPTGVAAPDRLDTEAGALRERFWLATSVHRDPNNYVYYGNRQGQFIGLWRFSEQEAELRRRPRGEGPRTLYRLSGIAGPLRSPVTEDKVFEPRERPWYATAMAHPSALGWTPVYVDFRTQDLIVTRTKRVANDVGEPEGVAATDLPLRQVTALLSRLSLSENAVAMVVEADGQLVGVSRGAHLKALDAAGHERLNARQSPDGLVAAAYAAVRERGLGKAADAAATTPRTLSFKDGDGRSVQVGYARVDPVLGLDWLIIAAVPRADFLAGARQGIVQAAVLAGLATVTALGVGWAVLGLVTRQLRQLAEAARRVGDGQPAGSAEPVETALAGRRDEIGELARSIADMQRRLLTDPLTGLSNRGAIVRHVDDRILQQRRRGDRWPFATLVVDVVRLKDINHRFGRGVGDAVLREVGQRLRAGVRSGDLVARYAGDEFVLLLESVEDRADAEAARLHLETALSQPLQDIAAGAPPGHAVSVSIGVAVYPDDGQDSESLLRHAETDMLARQRAAHAPDA